MQDTLEKKNNGTTSMKATDAANSNTVEILSLIEENGKTKIVRKNVNIDHAIIGILTEGFRVLCDPERYSYDRFKQYTAKWEFKNTRYSR